MSASNMARTGVPGLDDILNGGLAAGRLFLMKGNPGTGKTTMAMRFLMESAAQGEKTLYVTLSETEQELRISAASYGWTFAEGLSIFEPLPPENLLDDNQQQSLLYSSDLELGETTKLIFSAVEQSGATRIVLDSLSEIRLLAQNSLRYRRQVLALKHYFARRGATILMLDDLTTEALDKTVHSIAHGVIQLEQSTPDYGPERRRLRVVKYRAQAYRGGYHDFVIRNDGVTVFPRLVSSEHRRAFKRNRLGTGVAGLDALLGGGIEQGSSTLLLGPAGSGKSLLTLQFVKATLERGDKAAMFIFDEELGLLFDRAKPLGYDLEAWQEPTVEMELDLLQSLPAMQVDANQIELALLNLAINARDAMPDGGRITIRLHRCETEDAPDLAGGHYVCLTVADTGTGMDAETIKRAIEPFFSTKGIGKGTGLGLSMVHGVAQQLHGALRLLSEPGHGTRAELWLPVSADQAVTKPAEVSKPADATGATLLLVDDDFPINLSTKVLLEDLGHTVIEVNSDAKALEVLRTEKPIDLMITDYAMPGMTGLQLAEAARGLRPGLPILLATGYADLPVGAVLDLPRLSKPYHQKQLAEQITALVGQEAFGVPRVAH